MIGFRFVIVPILLLIAATGESTIPQAEFTDVDYANFFAPTCLMNEKVGNVKRHAIILNIAHDDKWTSYKQPS
jgi:hypothetical protein